MLLTVKLKHLQAVNGPIPVITYPATGLEAIAASLKASSSPSSSNKCKI